MPKPNGGRTIPTALAARAHGRIAGLAKRKPSARVDVRAADDDVPELLIYDVIDDWFGISAQAVVEALKGITAERIRVRINSPGGDVFAGLAIFNALNGHAAAIEVHVDGLAASAASIIAMAGDEVVMEAGTFLMVHKAWTIMIGNADEMRDLAGVLDKIDGELAGIYARRAGVDRAEAEAWMAAETWFTAEDAIAAGLADRAAAANGDEDDSDAAQAALGFDLAMFINVPEALADAAQPEPSGAPWATVREFEQFLRDAGCSRAAARTIAAAGFWSETDPRDEDVDAETLQAVRAWADSHQPNLRTQP